MQNIESKLKDKAKRLQKKHELSLKLYDDLEVLLIELKHNINGYKKQEITDMITRVKDFRFIENEFNY
tara:strand:- start:139 stop:342 length:204 start_codon:yes stop_codon:yes gene_type:complete